MAAGGSGVSLEHRALQLASVPLTPSGTLAVAGTAPIACDSNGRVYVADRAGFRVLIFDAAGKPLGERRYPERAPGGAPALPTGLWSAGEAIFLAIPEGETVARVSGDGKPVAWLGVVEGGMTFLKLPTRVCGNAPGTVSVWDPGLRLVVTMNESGKILASEKGTGLTGWSGGDGGQMVLSENPDGSWRLRSGHGGFDALLPVATAGGETAVSASLVGPAPAGGWIVHHYLGRGVVTSGACLRWLGRDGKLTVERVVRLASTEDLPPPPGSAATPDGAVYFVDAGPGRGTLGAIRP